MRESKIQIQKRARAIAEALRKAYPDARCELDHRNAFELLMATILSAQCTDKRVNMVTPKLFAEYPTAFALSKASLPQVEKIIQSTGFFRQKAKSLVETSKILVEKFNGEVPAEMSDLLKLRGVARKTANVVLGNCFGKAEGIVVDTHVKRLSKLMGLTTHADPNKIEKDLCELIDRQDWILFSHWLILHGRRRCVARRPDCAHCEILDLCPRKGLKKLEKLPSQVNFTDLETGRAIREKKR